MSARGRRLACVSHFSLFDEKFKNEKVRAQIVHGINPEGVEYLKEKLQEKMNVIFEEVLPVSPVLGAHTGPTLTGLIIGPMSLFADLI